MAIDYGKKRCGLAVTDPLKIIAGALTTVDTQSLMTFIKKYTAEEDVEKIVIGKPTKVSGEPSETMAYINQFLQKMRREMPSMPVELVDERFTTKIAFQAMIDGGLKRAERNNKNGIVDRVSAAIILQTYMETLRN